MGVAVTFVTASAVVGLVVPPSGRYVAWAGTACAVLIISALALSCVTLGLMAADHWSVPLYTGAVAVSALFPAWWLGRTPDYPTDVGDAEEEDDEGGGGGGPPKDPVDPTPPSPTSPGLDWDAFDTARESWTAPQRELVEV